MNINTALGMASERPLPTGIYYENKYELRRVDPPRDEAADLREQLAASKDTLASMQYSEAQHDLACEELGINLFPHEDGDTLIEAVCALKQQLADVTRERDVARREVNELAKLLLQAKNQLATVQRVLVDSLNLTEVGDEFAPPCVDVDNAMSLAAATEVAIDTLKLSAEKHKLDAEEANKALATVQAVAAAMRAAVELRLRSVSKILDEGRVRQPNNQVVQDSVWHGWLRERQVLCELLNEEFPKAAGRELLDELANLREQCKSLRDDSCDLHKLKPWMEQRPLASADECFRHGSPAWDAAISFESERTSNKRLRERKSELLDEMARKNERIRDLEERYEQMRENYAQEGAEVGRLQNKIRTAKLAYIETLRGKIDPAWFGEQSPVWQYRASFGRNYIWRTCDEKNVSQRHIAEREFDNYAERYPTWQACCDDPDTYPCDEHGKRIDTLIDVSMNEKNIDANGVAKLEQAIANGDARPKIEFKPLDQLFERIADLERQLDDYKRDAERCRELRALLVGVDPLQAECDVRVVIKTEDDSERFLDVMKAIRDGGAK